MLLLHRGIGALIGADMKLIAGAPNGQEEWMG